MNDDGKRVDRGHNHATHNGEHTREDGREQHTEQHDGESRRGRPQRGTRRSKLSKLDAAQTSPLVSLLSSNHPNLLALNDWPTQRLLYIRRLGQWAESQLKRMNLGQAVLDDIANRTGGSASGRTVVRIAELAHLSDEKLRKRERINLLPVIWLAKMANLTLSDVDTFLRTGNANALTPDETQHADALRQAYLGLSSSRRWLLEQFAEALYRVDSIRTQGLNVIQGMPAVSEMLSDELSSVGADERAEMTPSDDPATEVLRLQGQIQIALDRISALEEERASRQRRHTPKDDDQGGDDQDDQRRGHRQG